MICFIGGSWFSVGPAVVVASDNKSLTLTPNVQFNFGYDKLIGVSGVSENTYIYEFALSLDTAFQWWLTEKIGINFGFDIDVVPCGKSYTYTVVKIGNSSYSYSDNDRTDFHWDDHLLIGIALKF